MKIDVRNPRDLADGRDDPRFATDRPAFFKEIDDMIGRMEQDHAAGRPVRSFPPVRAGQKETIPGSDGRLDPLAGAGADGPSLGTLVQPLMSNVLAPVENRLGLDRQALNEFLEQCG